jgi:hypothetical protein
VFYFDGAICGDFLIGRCSIGERGPEFGWPKIGAYNRRLGSFYWAWGGGRGRGAVELDVHNFDRLLRWLVSEAHELLRWYSPIEGHFMRGPGQRGRGVRTIQALGNVRKTIAKLLSEKSRQPEQITPSLLARKLGIDYKTVVSFFGSRESAKQELHRIASEIFASL